MNGKSRARSWIGAIVVGTLFAIDGSALAAQEPTAAASEPSKESREQMARLHEQMAACLRSDKAFAECRTQMQTACHSAMGAQCPMMMGPGMQKHMQQPAPQQ
jgi:hypothetical protein